MVLKYHNYLKKYGVTIDEHLDWQEYTADKTFCSVLNIDAGSIPADKREAESFTEMHTEIKRERKRLILRTAF